MSHFHPFVVINKTALNCIHMYFYLLFKQFEKANRAHLKDTTRPLSLLHCVLEGVHGTC